MKRKIIIPLLFMGLTVFSSCDKKEKLNPSPTTSISNTSAFATADRILNQVRSLYSSTRSGQYYGGRYIIYNDIRADEFINELTNGVTGLELWNETQNNGNAQVVGLWSQCYFVINLCNVFMDGMAAEGSAVVGDALAKNYIAEARFVRALAYYSMLQLYARPFYDNSGAKPGLIIRLTGNTGSGEYSQARSTVAETYTVVLDDLNYAEANLPLNYPDALQNTTRAHRNTAIAMKTRVYLSMQRYSDAITEGNKLVPVAPPFVAPSGVAHALLADIVNVFRTPFTATESIFSMPFNANETPGTQNQLGYYYSKSAGNGEYSLNTTTGIVADVTGWPATDRRRFFVNVVAGKTWLDRKYFAGSPYTDFAPVIRYSEVLLNLAEALARTNAGVDARALQLLNAVRQRSDPTALTAGSQQALIDAIMRERRIEFLGEGRRSPDLLRLGTSIPAKATISAVPPTATNYIWPISARELILNPLCTDNL